MSRQPTSPGRVGPAAAAEPSHAAHRQSGEADRDAPLRARKLRDAALVLPVIGVVLLMPPVASLFAVKGDVLGVPVTIAYITAVWGGLILCAALMARGLREGGEAPFDTAGDAPEPNLADTAGPAGTGAAGAPEARAGDDAGQSC